MRHARSSWHCTRIRSWQQTSIADGRALALRSLSSNVKRDAREVDGGLRGARAALLASLGLLETLCLCRTRSPAVAGLGPTEREFSERDRDVLDLARPGLEGVRRAAQARTPRTRARGWAASRNRGHAARPQRQDRVLDPDAGRWLDADHPGWLPRPVAEWLALPPRRSSRRPSRASARTRWSASASPRGRPRCSTRPPPSRARRSSRGSCS